MLIAALLSAVLAIGLASVMFSNRERGFTPSQWLGMALIWLVLMVLAYVYQRIF
jgi:hypothetical protein